MSYPDKSPVSILDEERRHLLEEHTDIPVDVPVRVAEHLLQFEESLPQECVRHMVHTVDLVRLVSVVLRGFLLQVRCP